VQSGTISLHDGQTGEVLGQIQYSGGDEFDDVYVTPDGGLVTAWMLFEDTIVRFDASGNQSLVIPTAISGQSGDSELDMRVAADGLGSLYALGTFNNAIFKFTPEGQFVTRFGSDGDEPGQFRAPGELAVDNQGRIYVTDFKGIQVFAEDGRYLDVIDVDGGFAYGLEITPNNEILAAVGGTQIVKYQINE